MKTDLTIPTIYPITERLTLGESPMWHPLEQVLYFCEIPAGRLHCWDPETLKTQTWQLPCDVACCAPHANGGLVLGMRDGLWHFDPKTQQRNLLAAPPYDAAKERFNDGKCDPQGRFWVGTIYEPRQPPLAALYCFSQGQLTRVADEVTVSNGLAWSPDGATMYWTDTTSHTIFRMAFDPQTGSVGPRTVFATFDKKKEGQPLSAYGGRPDGAAMDVEGCYWVAMFEGARLLRISPQGQILRDIQLPVQCATMPCFGGKDMKTLFITTASQGRSAEELDSQALAGRVLALEVEIAGVPTSFFKG